MPDQFVEKLIYGIGVDVDAFIKDSEKITKEIREIGDVATKTFEQDFGKRLGQSIDPRNIPQIEKARRELTSLGPDAARAFERSMGRQASKALFDPFLNESQTFSGKLKATLKDSFSIKNLALGTAAGLGLTSIISGLTNVSTAIIKIAGDAAETRSKFNVIFGQMADDTRSFANQLADSVGRARIDIEDFIASFQTILKPMGFADEQAAQFSKTLTQLGIDVASFNNKLDADVIRDFQSALVGESEPVKKYGIIINETRVKQEALNLGIIETGQELTETGKVFVRYQILLKDTATAQGDAFNTADSFNNQSKRLDANLKNIADTIGTLTLPAMDSLIGALNEILGAIAGTNKEFEQFEKFAKVIQASASLATFQPGALGQFVNVARELAVTEAAAKAAAKRRKEEEDAIRRINQRLEEEFAAIENANKGFVKQDKIVDEINKKRKEEKKRTEEIAKIAESDIEKRLIAIKQETQERAKMLAGNKEALRKLHEFERLQIDQTIAQFSSKFEESFKQSLERNRQFLIDGIIVDIPVELNLGVTGPIRADRTEMERQLREDFRLIDLAVAETTLAFDNFVRALDNVGIQINAEFFDLVGLLDRNLSSVLESMFNFAASIASGNIVGAIGSVVSAISSFIGLGGRRDDTAAINAQREAQERAAEAARRAAEALERLRHEAELFSAGEFGDKLALLDEEFKNITNSTEILTAEQQALAVQLLKQAELIQFTMEGLEREREITTDPERLREIQEELQRLENELGLTDEALRDLGINLGAVTAAELQRLIVIGQERDVIEAALAAFTAFGDGLTGLIDRLNLVFDLRGITDNAEKLNQTIGKLIETFEQSADQRLTAALSDLPKFIEDGLTALLAGGEDLVNFLISVDLEELTAEEFARLLQMLQGFAGGVGDTTEDIAEKFRKFTDDLNFSFDLLDVTDPIEKIKQLIEGMHEQFGFILPLGTTMEDFVKQSLDAIEAGGDALKAFLASIGLEELTEEQFRQFLAMLEGFGDEIEGVTETTSDKLAELIAALNLEFDLFDITDPAEKLQKLREKILEEFGLLIPQTQAGIEELIRQGFAALTKGGDDLKAFLESVNLEELTAEQLEAFLRMLESFGDELGGTTAVIADKFRALIDGLNLQFELFDIDDPIKKVEMLIKGLHEQFGFILPLGTTLEDFVEQGFDALTAGDDALKSFLETIGLEELTREQFIALLQQLEGLGDQFDETTGIVGDRLSELMRRLQLEFDLFDVDDPVKQLERLRQEIRKDFGAIIPTTKEGIDALIKNGFNALMAGGDALSTFLASIDLEELTAEQFEDFLRSLEDMADKVQEVADEVGGDAEKIGVSIVKQITFQQANVLINEVATIREVVTQILNKMGGSAALIESGNEELVRLMFEEFDRRIGGTEIYNELVAFHRDFNDFASVIRNPIVNLADDLAALLRITPPSFGRVAAEIGFLDFDVVDMHESINDNDRQTWIRLDRLRDSIEVASARNIAALGFISLDIKNLSNAIAVGVGVSAFGAVTNTPGGATKRFEESGAGALFGGGLTDAGLHRAFSVIAREFDMLTAQNAILLGTLQKMITTAATVVIYIVRDGQRRRVTPAELDDEDRILAEKVISDMRGSGL